MISLKTNTIDMNTSGYCDIIPIAKVDNTIGVLPTVVPCYFSYVYF